MSRTASLIAAALLIAAPAFATTHNSGHHAADATSAPATAAMVAGEVKKVDKGAGKVTIKHGPLVALDMPAMTMVFRVKDPAMLDSIKAGDNIRFKAEKVEGSYTVTEYQPAK